MWGVRRAMSRGEVKMDINSGTDAEKGALLGNSGEDNERKEPPDMTSSAAFCGIPSALFAGLCYCAASGSMVLLNKHALASFGFSAPLALLVYQCAISVLLVKLCELLGYVRLQPLRWELIRVWFPVNLIFVGMIGSSFYALKAVGVGMVTVWKNLSNVVTALGDVFIFRKSYPMAVWGCLALMLLSAGAGASTDVRFSWSGYSWQLTNCIFTSAYALYLRSVMDRVSEHTVNKQRMDEFSMVYYNNLLSIPPLLVLMAVFGEFGVVMQQPALKDPAFLVVSSAGGLIGFGISFSSLWFLNQTTATIYSLVGALNKLPVALVGLFAFHEPTNPKNMASICLGLLAGVLFVQAKSRPGPAK